MILINGHQALGEGPGITFDWAHLVRLNPPKAGRAGKLAKMPDLLKRVVSKVDGPVRACLVPDQIYIDLHWNWTGWIRRGSPIVGFSGHEHHVALAIWSLWQNWPIVGKGPCKRLCKWEGCCNPHHFVFPMEPTPAPMTFSLTGDPGEEAAAELMRRHKEMERLIAEGPSE